MQPTQNQNFTSRSSRQANPPADEQLVPEFVLDEHAIVAWPGRKLWHGFLGRTGGVSRGAFESLNFSYLAGDMVDTVQRNWRRLQTCFPLGTRFVQVHQVHGNRVHAVDAHSRGVTAVADGMVTSTRGVILGILTADCVPVLLLDEQARIVAALHAGWRGVMADIASAGISAMVSLGARPQCIEAAMGPAIGACCFEVDASLARRFEAEIPDANRHVRYTGTEKAFIDLKALLRGQLMRAGVESGAITDVPICTRCSSARFFSRRAAGGGATGLQLSFIGLPD